MAARLRIAGAAGGAILLALILLYASLIRVSWQTPVPVVPQTLVALPKPVPAVALMHAASVSAPAQVAADPNAVSDHSILTVPVIGIERSKIHDNWGDPRDNGLRQHHGTDIIAPQNASVVAAAPGTVEKLYYSNGGGGISLYVRSPDRLWEYYYAHLSGYAEGLHEGQVVQAGELLGYVGDTGNAGTGNFHLHFGVSRMRPEDRWWQGEAVNPYRLLAGIGGGG
jgi:murein DD-endopeptidase MepM/ murein hydrolase activator NlpD